MEQRPQAADDAGDREFAFSTRDFERVRKMILKYAGISLNAGKQNMVYSRLSRRLRATGMPIRDMLHFAALRSQGDATAAARRELLQTHLAGLQAHIRDLQQAARALQTKIAHYDTLCPPPEGEPHAERERPRRARCLRRRGAAQQGGHG